MKRLLNFKITTKSLGVLLLVVFFIQVNANAAIKCSTMNGEKTFEVHKSHVAFEHVKSDFFNTTLDRKRYLSSSNNSKNTIKVSARNRVRPSNQIQKKLTFEGKVHLIHIENKNSFDSIDDYISITSDKGHKITYPLECSQI